MNSLNQRALLIYNYLVTHAGEGFTMLQLCRALGLQPGAKTRAAIDRARSIAAANGRHLPPAVPANGFKYRIAAEPVHALDPALHMSRIEHGVKQRADEGYEYVARHQEMLPRDQRPSVKALLAIREEATRLQATVQKIVDDMVVDTVKARREQRRS